MSPPWDESPACPLTPPPPRRALLREMFDGLQGPGPPPRREVLAELRQAPLRTPDFGARRSRPPPHRRPPSNHATHASLEEAIGTEFERDGSAHSSIRSPDTTVGAQKH